MMLLGAIIGGTTVLNKIGAMEGNASNLGTSLVLGKIPVKGGTRYLSQLNGPIV